MRLFFQHIMNVFIMLIQYLFLGSLQYFKIATNCDNIPHIVSLNMSYPIISFNCSNIVENLSNVTNVWNILLSINMH